MIVRFAAVQLRISSSGVTSTLQDKFQNTILTGENQSSYVQHHLSTTTQSIFQNLEGI